MARGRPAAAFDAANVRRLSMLTGASCVAIGAYHLAFGVASVPGETDANATVDSRERFYAVFFGAYGLAWLRAARRDPVPVGEVRALSALLAAGGGARVVSLVTKGSPHWFQNVLTAVEFALPAAFFAMTRRDR
jgi:hypothetical protein